MGKNGLEYRMRGRSITNRGSRGLQASHAEMYTPYYFDDWVVLNAHRQKIKDRITLVADGQWKEDISWAQLNSMTAGLQAAARNVLRVRPWFEAGACGGQWMKRHIPALPQDEINYAWSVELIVPENGIVFAGDDALLELSFESLMEHDAEAILGKDAARF